MGRSGVRGATGPDRGPARRASLPRSAEPGLAIGNLERFMAALPWIDTALAHEKYMHREANSRPGCRSAMRSFYLSKTRRRKQSARTAMNFDSGLRVFALSLSHLTRRHDLAIVPADCPVTYMSW